MTEPSRAPVTGLVLAGGQGRRLGGRDKGLVEIAGQPMIERVLARLRPQVGTVMVSANRNQAWYRNLVDTVVADSTEGYAGPLAGMQAGLAACQGELMVTVPCDSPCLPLDLVQRLVNAREQAGCAIAVAVAGGRRQPVFALMGRSVLPALTEALDRGERKIDRWFESVGLVEVAFDDVATAFANVNAPDDLLQLEQRIRSGGA